MSPDWELQKAIVAKLKTSAGLKDLIGDPPQIAQQASASTARPYIHIGESQSVGVFADCVRAEEIYVDLHIWSDTESFAEVKQIIGVIVDVLHDADLEIAGGHIAALRFRNARTLRDPNSISRHGVATFRAIAQRT
ncbi:DUF3168 domain-containing protein [Hansschlegelia beijingensis]|uniref:DUF3168 domain-containing protein n=1 Tax=Hansschlegelia beijingensis TaxID=1133344 RepID=A0A7W6D1Q3_9HYPH|nr:DUF3168 domain-containing protein [Hansschlegelia beijingensis]MBB3972780.1 hypothetical protein [Hansschlegelia beijingensis]